MNKHLNLARPDILTLKPYEHAVWDRAFERLHANENPWRMTKDLTSAGLNWYPECPPVELVQRLAQLYAVQPTQLTVGRGSDEGIDLVCRTFCRAGVDSVLICPPTFGFYKVAAQVQGAAVIEVPLIKDKTFSLDVQGVLGAWRPEVKVVFLCSPGNPTGALLDESDMHTLCVELDGKSIVVIDEAYIEFAGRESFTRHIERYTNVVVLRTLSKAYALAGARVGSIIAQAEIIELLNRVLPPYAIPTSTVETVLAATTDGELADTAQKIKTLLSERDRVMRGLKSSPFIERVWPSDANFILVECVDAQMVLRAAQSVGLIVRDQRSQRLLNHAVRITIGMPEQNSRLLNALAPAAHARQAS